MKTMRTLLTPFSFFKSGNIYLWKASGSYNKTQNTNIIVYTICDSKREGLEYDEFQDIPQVLSTYGKNGCGCWGCWNTPNERGYAKVYDLISQEV